MQNGVGEVAEVSYCYYSQDSRVTVQKFPCMDIAKFTDRDWTFWDVLPVARRGRFWLLRPAKGLILTKNMSVLVLGGEGGGGGGGRGLFAFFCSCLLILFIE